MDSILFVVDHTPLRLSCRAFLEDPMDPVDDNPIDYVNGDILWYFIRDAYYHTETHLFFERGTIPAPLVSGCYNVVITIVWLPPEGTVFSQLDKLCPAPFKETMSQWCSCLRAPFSIRGPVHTVDTEKQTFTLNSHPMKSMERDIEDFYPTYPCHPGIKMPGIDDYLKCNGLGGLDFLSRKFNAFRSRSLRSSLCPF